MLKAQTVKALAAVMHGVPDAVVSVVVTFDANTAVTTTGFKLGKTTSRAIQKSVLADNVDLGVWVYTSAFTPDQLASIPGASVRITDAGGVVTQQRVMTTREHPAGGIVLLSIGSFDKVTA